MSHLKRSIAIVLGMHRSGTSLCAHMLTRLGYEMTDSKLIHKANPKGHWEWTEIVAFHDRILQHFDRDYYSPKHAFALPAGWWADTEVQKIRKELTAWLHKRMGTVPRFGVKDPRTCLLLPIWKTIFEELDLEPRYIFCLRDPVQVARSIEVRNQFSPRDTEYRWVRYNAHAVAGVGDTEAVVIPYNQWFSDPRVTLDRLIHHLGSPWQPDDPDLLDAAADVISPGLRHDRADAPIQLLPFTSSFYALFQQSVAANRPVPELLKAAQSFVAIERLHAHAQESFASLSKEHAALAAAHSDVQQNAEALAAEIEVLQASLEQEKAASAKCAQEIAALKAALAAVKQEEISAT